MNGLYSVVISQFLSFLLYWNTIYIPYLRMTTLANVKDVDLHKQITVSRSMCTCNVHTSSQLHKHKYLEQSNIM